MEAFNPGPDEKQQISIRLDIYKLSIVDKAATKTGLSRNQFINQCIDYALAHMETDE